MKVLQEAMKVAVRPVQRCALKKFVVDTSQIVKWKCAPVRGSYDCDITEGEDMSAL